MIITAGNSHVPLSNKIARQLGAKIIIADTQKFEDQELRIQINGELFGQDVVIVQSTSKPSNDHLMELLLIADTVKRAGAKHTTAVMPYFGYSRQDRPSYTHGPISASLVANLIKAARIDRVIMIDLHSKQSEGFFNMAVQNLDPLPLFIPLFENTDDCVIVSPDIGGLPRARAFSDTLNTALAIVNKNRKQEGKYVTTEVIGNVMNKNCILIDDIIDTGDTLCKAAQLLLSKGARSVNACITHAVFSANAIQKIQDAGFSRFYTTNTINQPILPERIKIIPVETLIAKGLQPLNSHYGT
jgi:ribose-phosphate pyrophosphokinase